MEKYWDMKLIPKMLGATKFGAAIVYDMTRFGAWRRRKFRQSGKT